jgi:hypothetical protein
MVSWADALAEGTATEVAVTVTVAGDGTLVGAVYSPDVEIVPTVALPPATPLTAQVTVVSVVFARLAVKDCEPFAWTEAVVGQISIWTAAACSEQDIWPAVAGAGVVIALGLITTSALSWRPRSSVTTSLTVDRPQEGAVMEAVAVFALLMTIF